MSSYSEITKVVAENWLWWGCRGLKKNASELSGGMVKKGGLARAIVWSRTARFDEPIIAWTPS
jgi:ABC-type transporter Mla maintaining outer membrane lipid asymmetry ATPase subunit MlaF